MASEYLKYGGAGGSDLFIWGLQPHLATPVNIKATATLNKAMKLAKRASVTVQLAQQPSVNGKSSQQMKGAVGAITSGSSSRRPRAHID